MADARVLMIDTLMFSHFVKNIVHRASSGVEIIGVAAGAGEALDLIHIHKPDVMIIDLREESQDKLETLLKVRSEYPNSQIIGRIKEHNFEFIVQAITGGVMGFINDQTPFVELIEAIQTVGQGYAYMPQNLARHFVVGLQQHSITLH